MDLDLALRENEPPISMDSSSSNKKAAYEQWERSNRLSLMLIKSHINQSIRGSIPDCDRVKAYVKAIDEQFVSSDKALASTLMKKFASMTLDKSKSVHKQIIEIRDIAAKLKSLKVEISESFLVHFILNSFLSEYTPLKISYNTHKDKWSINELLTMCVQEAERLKHETLESVHLMTHERALEEDCLKYKKWLEKKGLSESKEAVGK
ncbi:uncharacterized protein LOC113759580 [Coffea eugenioides]|uniref:uncharacterized protein LOC113759580 n=1 Tax=Coffea eugenioides TaxID=49369 RepID=UPI000F60FCB4|nr:uncharacterized protein LOC113759580 [Coffea eugenioides]